MNILEKVVLKGEFFPTLSILSGQEEGLPIAHSPFRFKEIGVDEILSTCILEVPHYVAGRKTPGS